MAVPRVVEGIGAVTGMAGGDSHSLGTTAEGRVLAFGSNGDDNYEDSDGEELDEPFIDVDGRLGLGVGIEQALTPTAIDGITLDAGPGRMQELDRLIEGHGSKKKEAAARYAESLRCLEEDLDQHKAEKAPAETAESRKTEKDDAETHQKPKPKARRVQGYVTTMVSRDRVARGAELLLRHATVRPRVFQIQRLF